MNEIYKRISVRNYLEKDVEDEKILQIIKAGMQSPSAKNQQPWEFFVVKNKNVIEKLSKASPYSNFSKEAPVIIVACYRNNIPEPDFKLIDLAISVENMWLEVETLGLGACMIGIAHVKERVEYVNKILNLDSNLNTFCLFPVGYPAKKHKQQNRYDENKIHFIN